MRRTASSPVTRCVSCAIMLPPISHTGSPGHARKCRPFCSRKLGRPELPFCWLPPAREFSGTTSGSAPVRPAAPPKSQPLQPNASLPPSAGESSDEQQLYGLSERWEGASGSGLQPSDGCALVGSGLLSTPAVL